MLSDLVESGEANVLKGWSVLGEAVKMRSNEGNIDSVWLCSERRRRVWKAKEKRIYY